MTRPSALASCAFCRWKALHRADTFAEIDVFLQQQLLAHVAERHPEQRPTPPQPPALLVSPS